MGKMRPFKALISYREALDKLLPRARPLTRTEHVALPESLDRVLARDVAAPMAVPPFARAAMDGYAVKAHETFGGSKANPRVLRLAGTLHAGDAPSHEVTPGACVQIATGAMLPPGADAVVRVEDALQVGESIKVEVPVYPGRNVSAAGNDIQPGTIVARRAAVLTPAHVGVLASLGLARVEVMAKPKVAVLPTGSEVAPPGAKLREGQIYDSNTFTLTALVRQHGGEPLTWGAVPDALDAIEAALDKALAQGADLIVLSGGSSVGERDLLVDALAKRGELLFHGVQIRPGKPMLAADWNGTLVLGFPGYPVSCLTNAYVFLLPLLHQLAGRAPPRPRLVKGRMAERLSSQLGRLQIHPVRLEAASPVGGPSKVWSTYKESGALTSLHESDGYILIAENVDLVEEGEEVEVILW